MQNQYYRVIIYIESNDPECPLRQINQLSNVSEPDILDILNTSYPQFQVSQVHQTNPFPPRRDSLLSRIIKKQFGESQSENIDPNPNYLHPVDQYSRRRSMLNPPEWNMFEPESSRRRSMLNPPEFPMFEPIFSPFKKEEIKTPRSEKRKIAERVYRPSHENYSSQSSYEDSQRAYRSATCLKERPSVQNSGLMETVLDRRGPKRAKNSNHALTQRKRQEQDCPICLDPLNDEKFWMPLRNCSDAFHYECLQRELQMRIDGRSFPINCPQCRKNIHVEDINVFLHTTPQYFYNFEKYTVQAYLNTHPQEFDRCETPDCDYAYLKNPSQMRFDCPECQRVYCKNCKENWTNGHSCGALKEIQDYYANENRNQQNPSDYIIPMPRQTKKPGFTDQEFQNYANGKGYKACPKCQIMIERTEGCPHMTCRMCAMEFCYLTGQDFKQCRCGKH